ncbi:hypothetical protein KSS87_021483 [Heliosperma pusillum]|nr:hypothetical protein KSS87_021483 [Heliosperma pusillum]KAH9612804.1 hypothetical protein KSS87_021483 [Heliosperma pusillum]
MGNEAWSSHKELQCKQWVMQEDTLFIQGVTMQTMGNEGRKTHCSHNELKCKQWVMKEGRLIVHIRSYNANNR